MIAEELGLLSLRKFSFSGTLTPVGKSDWHLSAQLGATAVQSCVVTLEPVNTRIDEQVKRSFLRSFPDFEAGSELEMPVDETAEIMSDIIDPGVVMVEALALALPQFPRTADAELENANFTAPGKPAMTDADARPFAHLKSLRDGLKDDTK